MTTWNDAAPAQADAIVPKAPMQEGSDASNVRRIATAATHAVFTLPTGWAGKMVRIRALSVQAQVLFSDQAAPEVVYGVTATAAAATVGETVPALQQIQVWIPSTAVAMAHEASGTGVLELVLG